MAGEDFRKILEDVINPLRSDIDQVKNRISQLEEDGISHQIRIPQQPGLKATPMHPGEFVHSKLTDDFEEIYCADCGTTERRKIPTREVTKEIVKDKPYVPENYMPIPQNYADIQKVMDIPHPDDHNIFDCPECSPKLTKYLGDHGFVPAPVKKK